MSKSEVGEIKAGLAELMALVREINLKLKPLPTMLRVPQAAKEMGMSAKTLRKLIGAGAVAVKRGGGRDYVPLSEIRRWADGASRKAKPARGRPPKKPRATMGAGGYRDYLKTL